MVSQSLPVLKGSRYAFRVFPGDCKFLRLLPISVFCRARIEVAFHFADQRWIGVHAPGWRSLRSKCRSSLVPDGVWFFHGESFGSPFGGLLLDVENGYYSTHGVFCMLIGCLYGLF